MTPSSTNPEGPRLTFLGKLFVVLFVVACAFGAYYLFSGKKSLKEAIPGSGILSSGPQVELGIAYGTEKERWLQWAVGEWEKTSDGRRIKINLIPMGSLEGAHAILNGDKRINVWSPASSTYKKMFVKE